MIRTKWKSLLGDSLERFLLIAGDILREEELAIWMRFNPQGSTRLPPEAAAEARAAEAARRRRERGDAAMALALPATPMCRCLAILRTSTKSSVPMWTGCRPPC